LYSYYHHFWRAFGELSGELFSITKIANMSIRISQKLSKNRSKVRYYFEWGKTAGQRLSAGIFTYSKPKTQTEKNHNREALAILESKRSQLILDGQATGSRYIPTRKLQSNFLDFYSTFVKENATYGSRHLSCSYARFKEFLKSDYISAKDISRDMCERFRAYLLQHFNAETPANYFREFKRVIKAGKRQGYFVENPTEDLQSKENPNRKRKEVLEVDEWARLINTPCQNHEIKRAFITSMYVGLRWCDIKTLRWENIKVETVSLVQNKTSVPVEVPLHPIVTQLLGERKEGLVFQLPTADGANKVLKNWVTAAKIAKRITWHCARLSFSVLLQDESVNTATVAGMLGHTTTRQVEETYYRYRVHIGKKAIAKLPGGSFSPES
jgi:integrase/recombinase XerD